MEVRDQTGHLLSLQVTPERIVSLVPSQSELLYELGLEDKVLGITKFCIHPSSWLSSKTIIGGTKTPHMDKIESLQPDLIIANKEENRREDILALRESYNVWTSDITTIDDALEMIISIGSITGKSTEAASLTSKIKARLRAVSKPNRSALYLIWYQPWMAAGRSTFINAMMEFAGLKNVLEPGSRYPELSEAEIRALDPEVVLLSSEPYPFKAQHLAVIQTFLPSSKVILVDGEMFSWYGSRLLRAADYLAGLRQDL